MLHDWVESRLSILCFEDRGMGRAETGRKTVQEKLFQPWNGKLTENERVGENNEMGETFQTKEHDETCVESRDCTRQQFPPDELHRISPTGTQ